MGKKSKRRMDCLTLIAVLVVFTGDCSSTPEQPGYFLFTPPFGGNRPPKHVGIISKRNGEGSDPVPAKRAHFSPPESLWVGSHQINWSPLPIFQQGNDFSLPKQRAVAQARKFDVEDKPSSSVLVQKGPLFSPSSFKNLLEHSPPSKKSPVFHNPHHDFSSKITSGGFFSGIGAAIGRTDAPKVAPPNFSALPRSSPKPEPEYVETIVGSRSLPTTPLPSLVTSTILVSPPGTISVLSTPGPSFAPIMDRLRKMTQWSQSKQSQRQTQQQKPPIPPTETRKERKSSFERRLRQKKRSRTGAKKAHKNNIEAIILSNDDDDEISNERHPNIRIIKAKAIDPEKLTHKPRSAKRKRKSRVRNVSRERNENRSESSSSEEVPNTWTMKRPLPHTDIEIIHPTTRPPIRRDDPLDNAPSARETFQLRRKDKGLVLQAEADIPHGIPQPFSFRFGAEDARPNPYLSNIN